MFVRELFEAEKKVAVAAFGRMNPPTIGHEKLVNKVKSQSGDHYIFLSQTQKPKDNPLPFDEKLKFAKEFFPGVNVGHPQVRTPIQMLQLLEKLGYTDVVYVAGSDRVESFDKLFNDYNGKEYNFNSITVVNAGERDPDAEGAEGMSASKMRAAAAQGDLDSFTQGVPKLAAAEEMYNAVRKGMGIKDEVPAQEDTAKNNDDYQAKKKALQDIQADPNTAKDPELKKELARRKAELEKTNEILGFATKNPKRATIKVKKRPPEEDSVKDKIAKRRALAAKGNSRAFKTGELDEADLVVNKSSLASYLRDMIQKYVMEENDVEKLSQLLKFMVGKEIKSHGDNSYRITSEDIVEALGRG